jgi:NusA-like KH domain protein
MEEIQLINALYSVSNVQAKHCMIEGSTVTFLVDEQAIGKAIGRQGANIKKLGGRLNKAVEILPFATDGKDFTSKALKMYKIVAEELEVKEENSKKTIFLRLDMDNKAKLMRNLGRLKRLKQILKNDFEIESIRVR